jgi:prevent-host-death family protein
MTNINVTNFRRNLFGYLNKTVEFNDVFTVTTKNGDAVIMSKEEYDGLMETLYLTKNRKTYEEILEGIETPLSECVSEEDAGW